MKKENAIEFDLIEGQLQILHTEIEKLSQKHPNDIINKFKLKYINDLLQKANAILGNDCPLSGFEVFVDSELPSNSDVVFIVSQYLGKLDIVRWQNTYENYGETYWKTDDKSTIQTKKSKFLP